MIDSLNPNSAVNLRIDKFQEEVEEALWEIHGKYAGWNGFDLAHAIGEWMERAYGMTLIGKDRYRRVVEAERKIREAKPVVEALAETLQSPYGRVRVHPAPQQGGDETQ